jgi:orotate phosphoribosyltransferase-like protein
MDKTDARTLPLAVPNARRRRAVKLRERGMTLREVAAQCVLSVPTALADRCRRRRRRGSGA